MIKSGQIVKHRASGTMGVIEDNADKSPIVHVDWDKRTDLIPHVWSIYRKEVDCAVLTDITCLDIWRDSSKWCNMCIDEVHSGVKS